MSFGEGVKGMVGGIIIMLFGALMYSVGGYGVMEPIYRGIIYLGFIALVVSPVYYWVWPIVQRLTEA